jgi:agmatine/peptidylarginine deiminase
MTLQNLRFPAEWEPQSAILLAWPHAGTDWAERLDEVEETYIAHVAAITRFQRVLVCVAVDDVEAYARPRLASKRLVMVRVGVRYLP